MRSRFWTIGLVVALAWQSQTFDTAFAQSAELSEAFATYDQLYKQGRYAEAVPHARRALRLGTREFGPNDPVIAGLLLRAIQ